MQGTGSEAWSDSDPVGTCDVSELLREGRFPEAAEALQAATNVIEVECEPCWLYFSEEVATSACEAIACAAAEKVSGDDYGGVFRPMWDQESREQCDLLRCIFNPFHPIPLNPTWQTSTVLALAQGIYQDRAFDRLPILADALEDASCDNPVLLNHLRAEGPHTRGCWALDLCLNRE